MVAEGPQLKYKYVSRSENAGAHTSGNRAVLNNVMQPSRFKLSMNDIFMRPKV